MRERNLRTAYSRALIKPMKKRRHHAGFWNDEYKEGGHLALSMKESEDMVKFLRYLERESGRKFLNPIASVLDLGCGNGRNLQYLSETYGMRGVGYDSSREAIAQAKKAADGKPLVYEVRSIAEPIPLPDNSQTIVLDMMTSHFLNKEQRANLRKEIARVLKPGGWLFYKTFLRDGDRNAERLLAEAPAEEEGSYIHPLMKVPEHVFTEAEIEEELGEYFTIHRTYPSHKHLLRGEAAKRRSISVYAEKM